MTEQDNRRTPQRGAVGRRPVSRRPVQGRAPVRNDSSMQNKKASPEHVSQTEQGVVNQNDQEPSSTSAVNNSQITSNSSRPSTPNVNRNQSQARRKEASPQKRSSSTSVDRDSYKKSSRSFLSETDDSSNEINRHSIDTETVESENRWVVDAKTGVRHKELSRIPKNVLSAMHKVAKSGGTPSSSELKFIPREKDFEEIDAFTGAGMDAMAETFLGHLRVPPNEEELKRLREEYARRQQKAAEDYQHEQDEIMSTSGDDNLTYF